MDLSAFFRLLVGGPAYLLGVDLNSLKFDNIQIVGILGGSVLFILILKFLWIMIGRRKFYRKFSGHFILKSRRLGLTRKMLRFVIPCILSIPLIAFLLSLAGGHKDVSSVEYVQTEFRQQMVLFDCSISVGWESNEPKKSWAEVMRDGYIGLLNLRAGKKDYVSLWIFSRTPHLISDFANDIDYLRDKVFKAPYVLVDPGSFRYVYGPKAVVDSLYPIPKIILPEEKVTQLSDEGGTNLASALHEMVNYLDREGNGNQANTTFIVVTDGAPDTPVDKELEILRKKKIKLLVIYMYNSIYDRYVGRPDGFGREASKKIEQAKKFQLDVKKYGGHFYTATNSLELREMYQQIDAQEVVKYNQKIHNDKEDFSENFLRFGISILFFIILTGLLASIRKGTSP